MRPVLFREPAICLWQSLVDQHVRELLSRGEGVANGTIPSAAELPSLVSKRRFRPVPSRHRRMVQRACELGELDELGVSLRHNNPRAVFARQLHERA